MRIQIPENCREAPACIDYKAYVFFVPQELEGSAYKQLLQRLIDFGTLRHEMLGVFYVDTEWGLLVVPPQGFPEMKISFFYHITEQRIEQILAEISALLRNASIPPI